MCLPPLLLSSGLSEMFLGYLLFFLLIPSSLYFLSHLFFLLQFSSLFSIFYLSHSLFRSLFLSLCISLQELSLILPSFERCPLVAYLFHFFALFLFYFIGFSSLYTQVIHLATSNSEFIVFTLYYQIISNPHSFRFCFLRVQFFCYFLHSRLDLTNLFTNFFFI